MTTLPTTGTRLIKSAVERRLAAFPSPLPEMSERMESLDAVVQSAFQAGMREVMLLLPPHVDRSAERALREVILNAVAVQLDKELDLAERIRQGG